MEMAEMRQKLDKMASTLADFRGSLDLEEKETRIAELEERMAEPGFWDNQDEAQKVIGETNNLKSVTTAFRSLEEKIDNMDVSYELVKEEDDQDLRDELETDLKSVEKEMEKFELQMLLSEPHDANNAILELHPGAGGTESQDWASMLLRMYTRWAEAQGFSVETLDYLPGDEAGVKSVTLMIKGHNAFGYLKAEKGVHRLVRISPFDSSGRRHTSFVSCDVLPELDDNIEIDLSPEDIRVDTFRSSGAGGQHVNTTDSAVRMTHTPTNTVVSCQSERSQIKNREQAMKMLKAKLYQQELDRQREEAEAIRGEQSDIGWGSQIRSYVFHPYNMVKDHRTNVETGSVQSVMDGDLTQFIDGYLRSQMD
ncbi:peptide chain release factor 2 [Alkalicoccus urumqiensis]|uniref:Peptide chain release factor 2 n=1 Tax=Alkalicoccus urumqiensis TaxID=1548213 RepID=A0A2P6MH50_ALKUR|nr:peptide chain release factor 2 [Alkalicoccus urumqiensis]PRO65612.1 peptide chain release factor 2 [Alkalicoccus urumqiensis]